MLNGTDRSRTDDLLRVKQALFQLSYDPVRVALTVYINTAFLSSAIWLGSGQVTCEQESGSALVLRFQPG